jgi:hypothetical protein
MLLRDPWARECVDSEGEVKGEFAMMRTFIMAALAGLIAVPAVAQTRDPSASNPSAAVGERSARDSDAVIFRGKVIAPDPDPWIRNEIKRHAESGWPD